MHRNALFLSLLAMAACGAPQATKAPTPTAFAIPNAPVAKAPSPHAPREPHVGPHGEIASLLGSRVQITRPTGGEQIIEADELHPPSGDPGLLAILTTSLLYLDDGTLLVGVDDGTVTALDETGHRRFSLGFRGSIRGFALTGEGLVALSTASGVVALMSTKGELRWERQITPDTLTAPLIGPEGTLLVGTRLGLLGFSPTGDLLFSHAASLEDGCCTADKSEKLSIDASRVVTLRDKSFPLDGPHPAIPSFTPTFPLRYERVLKGTVVSLLATSPMTLFALVGITSDRYELVRLEGSKTTRFPIPSRASRSEPFGEDEKPQRAWLWIDGLSAGPKGEPLILARRRERAPSAWDWRMGPGLGRAHLLELQGSSLRERNELFEFFSEHPIFGEEGLLAAPEGPGDLVCVGLDTQSCFHDSDSGFHPIDVPATVMAIRRTAKSSWLTTDNGLFRSELHGKALTFQPVPGPEGGPTTRLAGTSPNDLWTGGGSHSIFHYDGKSWTELSVPAGIDSLVARAPDDVWSNDGRLHWDGKRWSLVHGAPPARSVVVRGREDLWLGGSDGLWHGSASTLSPVQLPAPRKPDEGAIPTPPTLPLGKAEVGYRAERSAFDLAKGERLENARSLAVTHEGALWVEAWDRVVEVSAEGNATTIHKGERIAFGRWFHPEAAGRGILLVREGERINLRDEIQHFEGGKLVREEMQLDHHDAVAIDGNGQGAVWIAGTFGADSPYTTRGMREYELSAHALVRASEREGFRPVLGLPSASFCDVAAAADGGAWFAGALNAGPMGEGILFHARGRLGSESTARFRAPASLLAVRAFGAEEAWAVGANGTVIHVAAGVATRYRLSTGAWLRAVAGSGPNDIWLGGDGGTLLHYDGREFHPVAHPLGDHAAFTGIAFARGAVWAVGPSGILRLTKRP